MEDKKREQDRQIVAAWWTARKAERGVVEPQRIPRVELGELGAAAWLALVAMVEAKRGE